MTTSRVSRLQQSGAVLLEVVLALALMLFAIAVINHGLQASVDTVDRLKGNTHALNLAMTIISELEMGMIPLATSEEKPFPEPFQDWNYAITTSSFGESLQNLSRPIKVEVFVQHSTQPFRRRMTQIFFPSDSTNFPGLDASSNESVLPEDRVPTENAPEEMVPRTRP